MLLTLRICNVIQCFVFHEHVHLMLGIKRIKHEKTMNPTFFKCTLLLKLTCATSSKSSCLFCRALALCKDFPTPVCLLRKASPWFSIQSSTLKRTHTQAQTQTQSLWAKLHKVTLLWECNIYFQAAGGAIAWKVYHHTILEFQRSLSLSLSLSLSICSLSC